MKQKSLVIATGTKSRGEQYLINGIAKGDSMILNEIYQKYSPTIQKFVKENNGTVEDAKDVFQDAIVIIYKLTQKKEVRLTSSFITYLYAICQRIWWKKLKNKKRARATNHAIENNRTKTEVLTYADERYDLLQQALKQLPSKKRKVIELYLDGLKMRDIAQLLQLKSEDYARKLKYKCQQQLIQSIQKHQKFEELIY